MAPELFTNTRGYSYKVDIFSLGCIFYYLLTGDWLFKVNNYGPSNLDKINLIEVNKACNIKVALKKLHCSNHAKDIFVGMINIDPEYRLNTQELL